MAALAIVGVLATGTALTGCGKKNIDYSVDGESGNGGSSDSGSLNSIYGIPECCDTTLDAGTAQSANLQLKFMR